MRWTLVSEGFCLRNSFYSLQGALTDMSTAERVARVQNATNVCIEVHISRDDKYQVKCF